MAVNWNDFTPIEEPVKSKGVDWSQFTPVTEPTAAERNNVRRGLNPDGTPLRPGAGKGEVGDTRTARQKWEETATLEARDRAFSEEKGVVGPAIDSAKRGWSGLKSAASGALFSPAVEMGAQAETDDDVQIGTDPLGNPVWLSQTVLPSQMPEALESYKKMGAGASRALAGDVARNTAAVSGLPVRPATQAMTGAKTFGEGLKALAVNPLGVIGDLGVQSSVQMAPALLATIATRSPTIAAVTAGISSSGMEYGSGMVDYLANQGVDVSNEDAINKALSDPKTVRSAMQHAKTRAGIVGAVDAASAGIASKVLVPARLAAKGIRREVANTFVAQPAAQMVAGAGGEAAAQLATTGEIKPGEVLSEAVGEMFSAPVEAVTFAYERQAQALKAQRAVAETPEQVGTLDAGIALAEARAGKAEKKGYFAQKRAENAASKAANRGQDAAGEEIAGTTDLGRNDAGVFPLAGRADDARTVPGPIPETRSDEASQDSIDEAELDRLLAGAFPDSETGNPVTEQDQSLTDADGQDSPILASRVVDDAPDSSGLDAQELDDAESERQWIEAVEGKADTLTEGFRALAKNPKLMKTPLYKGRKVRDIVAEMGPGFVPGTAYYNDDPLAPSNAYPVNVTQHLKNEDGSVRTEVNQAVIHETPERTWVDVSALKKGGGGAGQVYAAAHSLAANTGRKFAEDPVALSDAAVITRPGKETSAILKTDSSASIETGPYLASDRSKFGGPKNRPIPLNQTPRVNDDLRERLLTMHANASLAVPEIKGIRYDADTNQFRSADGRVVDDSAFERLASNRFANPVRETMVGERANPENRSAAPIGSDSLKVAALVETLRNVTDPESRSAVVEKLRALASSGSGLGVLSGILPSRRVDDQTSTPEFKRWFGKSKVVTAKGEPLIVHHGGARGIDVFKPSKNWGNAFFFTSDEQFAKTIAKSKRGEVTSVYVSLSNPAIIKADEYNGIGSIEDALKQDGVDGVILLKRDGSVDTVVATKPEQIKSATDNSGSFDPSNPSIRASRNRNEQDPRSTPTTSTGGASNRQLPESAQRMRRGYAGKEGKPTVESIRDTIIKAFPRAKRLLDSGQVKIVQSDRDVPASIRARSKPLSEADGTIQGFYDPQTGTSYLIADNIRDSATAVFLHEEGVHAGMKALMGDQFDAIADQLRDLEKNGVESTRKLIAEARQRVKDAGTPAIHVNEELIAHTVELAEQSKKKSTGLKAWLADVYAALSAWAARNGFKDLSVEDLRRIAVGAVGHQARVEAKPGAVMQSKRAAEKTLIIQHNLSEHKLLHADRMGGLAVPSLAITRADTPATGFGEITLLGDTSMADPKGYAKPKVFGADIYSPRYPSTEFKLDKFALKRLNAMLPSVDARPIYSDDVRNSSDMTNIPAFKKLAEDRGVTSYHEQKMMADDLLREAGGESVIFDGYSNSGNRKYKPHTIENVVKILKKDLRGGENISYGAGSLRAKFTPQFRSIKDIKSNEYRLMGQKDFDAIRAEIDNELFALGDVLKPYYKHDTSRFGFIDTVIGAIGDVPTFGVARALSENQFDDVSEDALASVRAFMEKLRNLPTAYFEAKILRDVSISEFKAAVIPDDSSERVRSILSKNRVEAFEYKSGDEADRARAIREAGESKSLIFSRKSDDQTQTINVDGKERSRVNSDGKPIAETDEAIRNFWRGFGESKVVDENGNPLRVFHGTTQDVDAFDLRRAGEFGDRFADAAYFTASPLVASGYAQRLESDPEHKRLSEEESAALREWGNAVIEQYRATKSTNGDIADPKKAASDVARESRQARRESIFKNEVVTPGANVVPAYLSIQKPYVIDAQGKNYRRIHGDAIAEAIESGADGVIVRNVTDNANEIAAEVSDVYVVFRPEQIKSSVGNSGAFDPSNPSILASRVTRTPDQEESEDGVTVPSVEVTEGPRTGRVARAFDVGKKIITAPYKSATDKLRRTKAGKALADGMDAFYDARARRNGEMDALLRPVSNEAKEADLRAFESMMADLQNDRGTAFRKKFAEASKVTLSMFNAWKKVADKTAKQNTAVGVKVFDPKIQGWRPIGRVGGTFWPRAVKKKFQLAMMNPERYAREWSEMVDILKANGLAATVEEAETFLNTQFNDQSSDDYFAGIERARTEKLPEALYDYSWEQAIKYKNSWADRISQIEAFGQKGPTANPAKPEGEDLFDKALNSTLDETQRDHIARIRENIYRIRDKRLFNRWLQAFSSIITGLQLGNPASAAVNAIGGGLLTAQAFPTRYWVEGMKDLLKFGGAVRDAKNLGILADDYLGVIADNQYDNVNSWIAKSTSAALKYGGFTPAESFARAHNMLVAKAFLRDSIKAWNKDVTSRKSKLAIAWLQRNGGFDYRDLLLENGEGPVTGKYLRKAVNETQGSYKLDQVATFMDEPVGKFLFKYQKFSTQVIRMFTKNHLEPFMRSVYKGEEVSYELDGKIVKDRVRNFMPLLRYFAAAIPAGMITEGLRAALFGYALSGPDDDEIKKAMADTDNAKALGLAIERGVSAIVSVGALGFIGNYGQTLLAWQDRQRFKSPLNPPAVSFIEGNVQIVTKAIDQGKLTPADVNAALEQQWSAYRTFNRLVGTGAMVFAPDSKLGKSEQAERDRKWVRKMARRYADAEGIEAKKRAPDSPIFTPNTPTNNEIKSALLVGDAERAKEIAIAAMSKLKTQKEIDGLKMSIGGSIRSARPALVTESVSMYEAKRFKVWAKANLTDEAYARLERSDNTFMNAAKASGLWNWREVKEPKEDGNRDEMTQAQVDRYIQKKMK